MTNEQIKYEFTSVLKAHAFHAQASQVGPATMEGPISGWYPETWNVYVSPEFDAIVEARRAS